MAILSLASSSIEAGKMGLKKAKASAKTAVAVKDIKDYTGDSLLDKPSDKYDAMKKIVRDGDITSTFHAVSGAVSGFFKGAYDGFKDNVVSAGFAILTLASKNKVVKTIGAAGCGIATAWNFISKGTNLFANKDTIEK